MKASKLTARGLAYVVRGVGRKIAKHHRAKQTPHGKQSVKKLMAHGASASSIELSGDRLIVENECEPIPAEHLKHIFEPFYRPDYARNQNDGGNGLGLYIVASILDSLKLTYSLEPMQKPLGMRFTITF